MVKSRRESDPENEDHIDERDLTFDWKSVAPRWLLITMLVASFGINGLLGTVVVGLVINRFNDIEKSNNDPKWEILARLSTVQAEQGVKIKQHDDDLKRIAILDGRMADVQSDLKILSARLARKGF